MLMSNNWTFDIEAARDAAKDGRSRFKLLVKKDFSGKLSKWYCAKCKKENEWATQIGDEMTCQDCGEVVYDTKKDYIHAIREEKIRRITDEI